MTKSEICPRTFVHIFTLVFFFFLLAGKKSCLEPEKKSAAICLDFRTFTFFLLVKSNEPPSGNGGVVSFVLFLSFLFSRVGTALHSPALSRAAASLQKREGEMAGNGEKRLT